MEQKNTKHQRRFYICCQCGRASSVHNVGHVSQEGEIWCFSCCENQNNRINEARWKGAEAGLDDKMPWDNPYDFGVETLLRLNWEEMRHKSFKYKKKGNQS